MPSAGQGETFRIKAVCTFIRRDPVYKVCENDHHESNSLSVVRSRLVLDRIARRNCKTTTMEPIIVPNVR